MRPVSCLHVCLCIFQVERRWRGRGRGHVRSRCSVSFTFKFIHNYDFMSFWFIITCTHYDCDVISFWVEHVGANHTSWVLWIVTASLGVRVIQTTHSNVRKYRTQTKIPEMRNEDKLGKTKAEYILASQFDKLPEDDGIRFSDVICQEDPSLGFISKFRCFKEQLKYSK